MPLMEPTVATDKVLELHVPPLTLLESVVVVPSQKSVVPVIVAGMAYTVKMEAV